MEQAIENFPFSTNTKVEADEFKIFTKGTVNQVNLTYYKGFKGEWQGFATVNFVAGSISAQKEIKDNNFKDLLTNLQEFLVKLP